MAGGLRVRRALEEVGQTYDVRLLSMAEMKEPVHLARHPFGQIPSDREWLDGALNAGDLMMVAVLFRSRVTGILDDYPNLSSYVARGEARPAFKRAFAAQLAVFTDKPPTGG